MNSMQRLLAAVNFAAVDRPPVVAQVFGHAATVCGVQVGDYVRDGALLARCQLEALQRYGYDAVFALMDVSVETEAAGSLLHCPANGYPSVERYALSAESDFTDLVIPDPYKAGRMPELLRAARLLREELGDEVPVIGCVLGPTTMVMQLLGVEAAMLLAVDEPERFEQAMDYAVELLISYGKAQLQAGVHLPLIFDPSSSPEVIPAGFFRELVMPRLKKMTTAFREAGAGASWLHIAGKVEGILQYYPEAGVDIANFDYCVPADKAMELLPKTCLDGNLTPYGFVDAPPEEVADQALALVQAFSGRGGFILSSGCEIPPEASPANVEAMVAAARKETSGA